MAKLNRQSAISKINRRGVLLVYPKANQKEPASLWSEYYPRTKMNWDWEGDGEQKVANMWRLMKDLSDCREVVYSKWYQGRATFFSRELFTALLAKTRKNVASMNSVSSYAKQILEILEADSPLSTCELKRQTGLQGRYLEATYNRSIKDLFARNLIVAFGEVDDGAFPSLAVGATSSLYEDLCERANSMNESEAQFIIDKFMPAGSLFRKVFDRTGFR